MIREYLPYRFIFCLDLVDMLAQYTHAEINHFYSLRLGQA